MSDPQDDYWPCACVKRWKDGSLTHIKLNHRKVKRCKECGSERPPMLPKKRQRASA